MTQDQGQSPQAPQAQQAPPVAGPTGQRVIAGRYGILREIGRGGMGVVWLAEDRMIGRRVAIKELHLPDGVPSAERGVFEERVLREARTAGRLNDPAVVTVYDVLQDSGTTNIVMELIEAPTLSDIVRQRGPLPQDAVAALAGQLLSALESAHAAGIVHRDVKPSNVMVLPNGRVKLTDFGIAQSVDDPRLTTSGVLIGSPTYMAPERIQGAEADAGSDLWALGAVLFFAVEGYSPFERSSTAATMHAIMTEVPFLTRCQGPLASVIMGLLINSPQARLTAAQVRGLLAQVAPGPQTGPQTVMYAGQNPYANPTMAVTGPQPPRPRGRARTWLAVALAVLIAAGAFAGGWFTQRAIGGADPPQAEAVNAGTMTYGEGGDIPEFKVNFGYCSASPLRKDRSVVSTSECNEPHDFQVYGTHPVLNDSTPIEVPELSRLREFGEAWCGLVFASGFITEQDKSTLEFVTLVPTKALWDDTSKGSRDVVCVVQRRDGSQLDKSLVPDR